jgi:hypothetical protein
LSPLVGQDLIVAEAAVTAVVHGRVGLKMNGVKAATVGIEAASRQWNESVAARRRAYDAVLRAWVHIPGKAKSETATS